MAFTVTSSVKIVGGRRVVTLLVTETSVSGSAEWNTSGHAIPDSGEIRHYQAKGSTGTIAPRIGKATGWTDNTIDAVVGSPTAGIYHNEGVAAPYSFKPGQARILYGKSVPSTSMNVETIITIVEQG